jgi:hypothetical protein
MTPAAADRLLAWVLRLVGGVELLAIPFILFPLPWMDAVHARLFGQPLPHGPVVEYMARSLSILYAGHGALVVRMSFDVVRFRPLVTFLGWLHLYFGTALLAADLAAGMPWFWTVGEGPFIAAFGVVILLLARVGGKSGGSPAQG